jgi:hypothetical protein
MKRIIVILLLSCFFLNIIGYHIIFYIRQAAIRDEMKRAIRMQKSNRYETDLIFSLNDQQGMKELIWDGDDEFSLKGEMYDVIEKRVQGDNLIIRALADKKETALVDKASDGWKENDKSNKIANELFQLLQTLFHHSTEGPIIIKPLRFGICTSAETLPFWEKRILTPPPQISNHIS